MSEPARKMLSLNAMALEAGVGPYWLRTQVESGAIPAEFDGRRFTFDRDAVWARLFELAGYGPAGFSRVELVGTREMAKRLGLSDEALKTLADAGGVPCYRCGERYLFNPGVVEQLRFIQEMERCKRPYRRWSGQTVAHRNAGMSSEEGGAPR